MNPTLALIDSNVAAYTPTVLAGIQAAEALGVTSTGPEKAAAVVSSVSQSLESSPNANVAGIAALVNLAVQIANMLGAFKHKAKATA